MTRLSTALAILGLLSACTPVPPPAKAAAPAAAAAVAPAAPVVAPVAPVPVTECNYGFTLRDGVCVFSGFGHGKQGTSWG